ncbi:exodeoxyribonuclease VII large subunit [Conchiformibius kuhniae]|uniref:Exodeoxyribonuclease 7 large subunit n=1 Tax=Conchiformibius kuhniae TaxID=211502 RepID=A0A8T9MZL0_9NEIS|nr:exodeoxyribonuclease VII large subunit [Conchiformibius kuhniae]
MTEWFAPAAVGVSDLNGMADELLAEALTGIWVAGEVANLTRAASGHWYFVLKDAAAQVRCTLFKHAAAALGGLMLREGDHVEVCGKIGLYRARGEFQINVAQVRRVGLGTLYARYEALKRRLQQEGLFASERKRAVPQGVRTVGVVSSLAAAALRDVLATLRRRAPDVAVVVYPAPVQGRGSATALAQAVQTASQRAEVDVLLLCRGGGGLEDLWAFNEEVLVRAVAASAVLVICGVGHETDVTLADFAADVRAATPTAAAELAVADTAVRRHDLQHRRLLLRQLMRERYRDAAYAVRRRADALRRPDLHGKRQALALRRTLLASLSPYRAPPQGCVWVRDAHGRAVPDPFVLREGQHLFLHWAQGRAQVAVLAPSETD